MQIYEFSELKNYIPNSSNQRVKSLRSSAFHTAFFLAATLLLCSCQNTEKPQSPWLAQAEQALTEKRVPEAMQLIGKTLAADSIDTRALMLMADAYLLSARPGDTKDILEKCLRIEPENQEAMLKLAQLHYYLRSYGQAVDIANRLLQEDPGHSGAWYLKGLSFSEGGDTSKAISSFERTLELAPAHYDACVRLALIYATRNRKIALEYLNKSLVIRPHAAETYYNRAIVFQETGETGKAVQDYLLALLHNPGHAEAAYNLGHIYFVQLKQAEQAITYFSRAIQSDSLYAEAFYNRGLCEEALGNYASACADYKQAHKKKASLGLPEEALKRVCN